MKRRLCYCLAILCIITICDADEHHYSNYSESNPLKDMLKDVEIQITFETNKFSNDGSPIPCKVSLKITGNEENLKNSKWLGSRRPLIGLSSITTEEDQETGLWFELLNSSGEKVPLANNRLDACDCIIENREWKTIFYDLRRIFKISDVGEYKIRVFYELHINEGSQAPKEGEDIVSTHYKDSVFSDWATFEIVDNSKERDAKIKEYRDAFSSGDKKRILESLSALEKDSMFNAVRLLYNEIATLADTKDKEIAEKAAQILFRALKDESPYDRFFFGKFEKDKELLGRIVTNASSSESDELRLLAAKAMYPNAPLPKSFFKKQVQEKWFKREKNVEIRRAIVKNIGLGKKGLEDAVRTDPDVEVKVNALHGFPMCTIADFEHILSLAKELENDKTPVVYEGKETTVGKVMSNEIKWLQETIDDYKSAEVPESQR